MPTWQINLVGSRSSFIFIVLPSSLMLSFILFIDTIFTNLFLFYWLVSISLIKRFTQTLGVTWHILTVNSKFLKKLFRSSMFVDGRSHCWVARWSFHWKILNVSLWDGFFWTNQFLQRRVL